jgi:hypothetical protein
MARLHPAVNWRLGTDDAWTHLVQRMFVPPNTPIMRPHPATVADMTMLPYVKVLWFVPRYRAAKDWGKRGGRSEVLIGVTMTRFKLPCPCCVRRHHDRDD